MGGGFNGDIVPVLGNTFSELWESSRREPAGGPGDADLYYRMGGKVGRRSHCSSEGREPDACVGTELAEPGK